MRFGLLKLSSSNNSSTGKAKNVPRRKKSYDQQLDRLKKPKSISPDYKNQSSATKIKKSKSVGKTVEADNMVQPPRK